MKAYWAESVTRWPAPESHEGILHKLGDALRGVHDTPAPVPATQPPPEPKHQSFLHRIVGDYHEEVYQAPSTQPPTVKEGFMDRLTDKLTGKDHDVPGPVAAVPPPVPESHGLFHNISSNLRGQTTANVPPSPTKPEHEHVMEKIHDAFKSDEAKAAERRAKEEAERKKQEEAERATHHNIFGKIGDALHRDERVPPSPEQSHSVFDKIGAHMLHEELPKPEEQGLKAKVTAALGGGAQAEAHEAIDFVQQHILRQGTQSHESFWEQMKDEQIANMIRKQYKEMTGHEFLPSHKTA
ncbi:uncharacterized protein EV420DRAFT_1477479 [Desarmillaria tabescens]|uniref:Uncharacterized protein n=1 Tax=Armillaria tabescens TaxID=1929756 RepID=A0AA39N9Y1_ARMTA|nr:uncharacterized protein EV420DRAFT_1477479 [Desarmillaria tabescens]KAK0461747.1 hypothetical protein EV420DRAFT_1477479 [Desarmillaria tabescens]